MEFDEEATTKFMHTFEEGEATMGIENRCHRGMNSGSNWAASSKRTLPQCT